MFWCRTAIALLLLAALAGCGFQPVYGRADTGGTEERLAQIQIAPIQDRVGQILRNELLDIVTPRGQPRQPIYRLKVELRESIQVLAVRKNEIATRANLRLAATVILIDVGSAKNLFTNSAQVVSSYNILTSDYGTIASENNAREKAARALSGDIKNLLISYFLRAEQAAVR